MFSLHGPKVKFNKISEWLTMVNVFNDGIFYTIFKT